MPTVLPPANSELVGVGSTPDNATFRAGMEKFLNFAKNLLSSTGTPAGARAALGVSTLRRRNKWINGKITVDVRNKGVAKTLIAGAAPVWTVDRIYASCVGANATVQQTVNGAENRLLITGGAGTSGVTIGTRIISENMGGFNFFTALATLTALVSAPTGNITWAAYTPSGGGKNGFGTLAAPTRTLVASGTYAHVNTNQSEKRLSAEFALTAGSPFFTGVGIEPKNLLPGINIEITVGAQINGSSASFGEFQLEPDHVLGNWLGFEDAPYEDQVRDCEFYCREVTAHTRGPASAASQAYDTPVYFGTMFKTPDATYVAGSGTTANAGTPTFLSLDKNSARHGIVSLAAGDCYALDRKYLLDAEV